MRQYSRFEFTKDVLHEFLEMLKCFVGEVNVIYPINFIMTSALAVPQKFPTAKDLAQAKPKQIEKIIRSIPGNSFGSQEIDTLISGAQRSMYSGRAKEARGISLRIILTHIAHLVRSIQELEEEIGKVLSPQRPDDPFPGENLLTLPGVGQNTVAAVLSYLGEDGANFSSSTRAVGYVGYYPKIYQSGE